MKEIPITLMRSLHAHAPESQSPHQHDLTFGLFADPGARTPIGVSGNYQYY